MYEYKGLRVEILSLFCPYLTSHFYCSDTGTS